MALVDASEPQPNVDVGRMAPRAREASEFLKALAHESRLMILCDLLHGEKSVGELEALLARRQSTVSQQLARLRLEGLVSARRDGKTIYYSIASDKARSIIGALYEFVLQAAGRRLVGIRSQSARRRPLAHAPASVRAAAPQSAIDVACWGARPNATAISAVPSDWPISRPVDCRPAAPPLRSRGALPMMSRLLGDWKKPKPRPQIASRQTSEPGSGLPTSSAVRARPAPITKSPMLPRMPGMKRSARRPAIGAISAVPTGQGVSRRPVAAAERPSASSK